MAMEAPQEKTVPMGAAASRIVEITDEDETLVIAFVPVDPSAAATATTLIVITMNNKQAG
jgi:hypothetical protein